MEDPGKNEVQVVSLMSLAFFRQYINTLKLPLESVYYNVNIGDKLDVFDLGDLNTSGNTEKDMLAAHLSLRDTLTPLLSDTKCTREIKDRIFVIGGSNDCSLGSAKALADTCGEWVIIHIDGGLDCNEEMKSVNSNSVYRDIHELAANKKGEVITFGCQTMKVHGDELDFVKSKGGKVFFLKKDIRSQVKLEPVKLAEKFILNTAAGIMLNKILSDADKLGKSIIISWDASSLRVCLCIYYRLICVLVLPILQ